MNRSELLNAVSDWLHRADLDTPAATFLQLAESRLNRDLLLSRYATTTTLTIPAAASSVDLPADYREGRSLTSSDGEWTQVSPERLGQRVAAGSSAKEWAVYSGALHIPFAAEEDITLELAYWQRIPALTELVTTNWLIETHPDVYLWSALELAAVYTANQAVAVAYGARAAAAIEAVRRADSAATYFAASLQADYVV